MEEAAGNAVLEVGKCLAAPIGRQFMYSYNYKSNFDNLKREIGKLKDARDEVKGKVVAAEKNVATIRQQVKDWQRRVDSIIDEADKLIQEKANSRCFNLITCYKYSRKAWKKVEAVTEILQEKETFGEVSLPTTHEDIRLTNKDYEEFESRRSTLNGVLNAVEDAEVGIIGVYGMGGIGKTTLVKEVGQQAKKKQLLDEVVFVEVSDKPDTKKIQDELAHQLGVKFDTEDERASKLYARLKNDKKILVILDNIWEQLKFEDLGIPCGDDRGGCKVLLTARDLNVLPSMDSVKYFRVGFLTEEEAWSLFERMAGDVVDQTIIKLNHLPRDVCKECGSLPIIITTMARALRNKGNRSQWEDALRELRMPSPKKFAGLVDKEYSKIALSYKYLKGDEHKRIFLVCSLMVNDTTISDLFKYIMGLDILEGVIHTIEQARNRLKTLVYDLKDACLLLDGRTNEYFSMHDVVRVVAITIAYKDQHVFTERNNKEQEWSNKDELKKCTKISVADTSVISELWPEGLDCPKLEFFSMRMKGSFKIPENFFVAMGNLRVLSLSSMEVSSLPSSLSLLINLQTLCLNFGKFADITIIGELRKLKILSLRDCEIKQLPGEIGKLTELRLLDLSNCQDLKVIAPNVIACLLKLEELYMSGCSIKWEVEGLEELKHLSDQLTALEIDISDDKILPKDLLFKKLERYRISIGDRSSRFGGPYIDGDDWGSMSIESFSYDEHVTLRSLKLKFNSVKKIWLQQFQCFKNVEFLCLDKLEGIKNDVYELDEEGFSQLKHLHVHNNPNIVCIVDSTKCISYDAFPLLESVILFNLINLKKICYGQPTTKSFYNLKVIEVKRCAKLENIFTFSNASRSLPQLQRIRVEDCENMNEIFAVEREDRVNKNEVIDKIEFFQLRFLTLIDLPRFASFYSKANTPSTLQTRQVESSINLQSNEIYSKDELVDTVTPIFNKKVIFPSLEALELKGINSEKIWDNQLPTISCGYQNLKSLIVRGCQKLKCVFPSSIIKSFEQLQHLAITDCKELKEIVAKEEGVEAISTFIFPRVTFLQLEDLPELATFYPGVHTSEWPLLKKLVVCKCDKIKISTSDYTSFRENNKGQLDIWEKQSLFLVEKINPKLEKLTFSRVDDMVTLQHQFPENFFSRCTVEIKGDRSTDIPVGILQRLNNLENLILTGGSYQEIFTCEEDEKRTETLIQLRKLELSDLSDVKYLWRNEFKLDAVLQNLEVLEVSHCYRMINVLPSSASFENLTVLKVRWCSQLINVVTPSVANHLVQLREMEIEFCRMMTEIVSNEKDVAVEDEIVFSKLKLLSLSYLDSLTCFYPGKYTLNFPSLKELIVHHCPKMKSFSGGILSTPCLLKVQQKTGDKDDWCWESDLNTTIQHMYKEKVNSNSEFITLSGEDITSIRQDQFPEHQFSKVKVIEIINDDSAHFPIEVLEGFNNLEKLILKVCSYKEMFSCGEDEKCARMLAQIKQLELWGLFNLKDIWKQDSIIQNLEMLDVFHCHTLISLMPSSANYENLTTLSVRFCDGLINLVSSSTAKSLVRLKIMTISQCGMMAGVVSNEGDTENNEIVFDKLESLSLFNLKSLTSFCSGNYMFKFPFLEHLFVERCPNMNTFSRGVLSTPNLDKVKNWHDNEKCWEGDLNTTIQHLHRKVVCRKLPGSSSSSA